MANWLGICSLIVAVFAWIEACRSRRIAEEAFSISSAQENRLRTNLELVLVDYKYLSEEESNSRIYIFRIMLSNISDAPNSIRTVQLKVEQLSSEGTPSSTYIADHDIGLGKKLDSFSSPTLEVPFELTARASKAGLTFFRVPIEVLGEEGPDSYTVRLTDTFGDEIAAEAIFVNEHAK